MSGSLGTSLKFWWKRASPETAFKGIPGSSAASKGKEEEIDAAVDQVPNPVLNSWH